MKLILLTQRHLLRLKLIISCLLVCWLNSKAFAQEYTLEINSYGVEEGLPTRYFESILEDQTGFIWMASKHGLHRFDGIDFKHYPVKHEGQITQAIEGPSQHIWVHRAFLKRTDYNEKLREERFSVYVFDPKSATDLALEDYLAYPLPFKSYQISSMHSTGNESVLVGTIDGKLYELEKDKYILRHSLPKVESISQLIKVKDGYWLTLSDRIIKIDINWVFNKAIPYNNVIRSNSNGSIIHYNTGHAVYSPVQDRKGQLHALTLDSSKGYLEARKKLMNKWYTIDGLKKKSYTTNFKHAVFAIEPETLFQYALKENDNGRKSIVVLNNHGKTLAESPLQINHALFHFIDSKKNLWVTSRRGVHVIKLKKAPFNNYINDLTTDYGIPHASRGIAEINDSTIVIGGSVYPHRVNVKNGEHQQFTSIRQSFAVKQFGEDLWITREYPSVHQINMSTGSIISYDYENDFTVNSDKTDSVQNGGHWSIHKDRYGTIWLGARNGLSIVDSKTQTIKNTSTPLSFSKPTVMHIYENNKGLWLATLKGIYLWDPLDKKVLKHYHPEAAPPYQLPVSDFVHLYEDAEGIFWLSSLSGGLVKWEPETGDYEQYTTENGLSHNTIYAVYEDHNQNLWIPSYLGINQFNKVTENVSYFLTKDGIGHNEFNRISHYRGHDSTLYFGGENGATSFHPRDFVPVQPEKSSLVITEIAKRNKKDGLLKDALIELEETSEITLSANQSGISLEFRLLNFNLNGKNRYAYKIEGIDADWIYQSTPSVNINKLPFGSYIFLLKANGERGLWTEPISFQLTVLRPFYLQAWFIILSSFIVLISIYLLFYLRNRRHLRNERLLKDEVALRTAEIQKQALELKKLDAAKSQFFANISHELRTPLSLILGPTEQLIKDKGLSETQLTQLNRMYRNGKSLSNLVEEILELSKLEAGKLEVFESPTLLKPYLNRIHSAYESLAFQKGIEYSSEFNFFDQTTLYLDTGKLEKIINNLLSNALKFTSKGGFVKFSVFLEKKSLRISVEDSGIGISAKDIHSIFDRFYQSQVKERSRLRGGTGIGLALVKELTEALGGTIRVESTPDKGSHFEVILPKKEAKASDILSDELVEDLISNIPQVELTDSIDNGQEFTILIVEDNQDMRSHIYDLLNKDYRIIQAEHGKVALELLKNQSIDLVITDVMMPEMDGFTLFNRIKSNDLYRGLPIIMLTALAEDDDRLNALTIGVDDYITKPFLANELKARVKNLLANYQNRNTGGQIDINQGSEEALTTSINIKVASQADLQWIKNLEKEALSRLTDIDFSMETLASSQGITARHMQRKIKEITGLKPNQYVQTLRLQLSRSYLERKAFSTVNEVTKAVGFQSSKYFSKLFKEKYGKNPSEYLNKPKH